ncbi:MAG: DUF58 domain-containing protein [Verrucomicrobiota bacterium]
MAEGINSFLNPAELQKLGRLTLQSRYVVEGSLAGRHRSPNKGSSTEFAEHRNYNPGDDPKHLDWKVLGRTDRYFVRRYEDETNLRVYLAIDQSASMGYASGGVPTKYAYACHLAAAIGYVVVKGKDSAGMYVFADKINAAIGARNSFAHLNNTLATLKKLQPSSTTAMAKSLHRVAEDIRRRALVLLFSDLFDDQADVVRAVAHFRKLHHDVIVFHILDPMEVDFSFKQGGEFIDMETGEAVAVDPRAIADDYRKVFGEFLEAYRKPFREMNVDYRMVKTSEPVDLFVRAYLEERKRFSR